MKGAVTPGLVGLLQAARVRHRKLLMQAGGLAALVGASSVALLGLSGWFITGAALAGAAGFAAAHAFNYLLPSACIRLLAIARTGGRYGERLAGHAAALLAMADLRPALFRSIAHGPAARAMALTTGEASAAMVQDIATVESQFVRRSAPWSVAASTSMGLCLVGLAGWLPCLVTACCLLTCAAGGHWLKRRMRESALRIRGATAALKDELAMLAASQPELRCHALEAWAVDRIEAQGHALGAAQRDRAATASLFEVWLFAWTGVCTVLAIGLGRFAGAPLAALAGLAALMCVDALAPWLRGMLDDEAAGEANRHIDRLLLASTPVEPGTCWSMSMHPSIRLGQTTIQSSGKGSRLAVVGKSGAGKTTLIETLLGLREVSPGELWVDGRDVARAEAKVLRACFAWLPQDAMLLAGSVRENLALSDPQASEPAMWRALRDAGIDETFRARSKGLDSWVGEDGGLLSGGQRRRLALARAYLSTAPWLLLDEPTEGLDDVTEALVLERLEARLRDTGQSLIVVSHRPTVTALCTTVLHVGALRLPGHGIGGSGSWPVIQSSGVPATFASITSQLSTFTDS